VKFTTELQVVTNFFLPVKTVAKIVFHHQRVFRRGMDRQIVPSRCLRPRRVSRSIGWDVSSHASSRKDLTPI